MKKLLFSLILCILISVPLQAQSVIEDKIVFNNGNTILSGSLYMPDDIPESGFPAIIFQGGIDEFGRVHPLRGDFINDVLIDLLVDNGIALLVYEPRGVGSSSGRWQRTTLEEFAQDVIAAYDFLTERREINPQKIGLMGHSEGGWVTQIATTLQPDSFHLLVSLASPPFDAEEKLFSSYYNEYLCEGMNENRARDKALEKAKSHINWVNALPITRRWRHMKLIQDYNPRSVLNQIDDIPFLYVYGENDGTLNAEWVNEALSEIFDGEYPDQMSVIEVPGATHFFKVGTKCYDAEGSNISRSFSFRFKDVLRSWVIPKMQESEPPGE